jgi:hypothetical protein
LTTTVLPVCAAPRRVAAAIAPPLADRLLDGKQDAGIHEILSDLAAIGMEVLSCSRIAFLRQSVGVPVASPAVFRTEARKHLFDLAQVRGTK